MKRNVVLVVSSLLSLVLVSLHLTDDIVYGTDRSPVASVVTVAVLVIWLYGTLAIAATSVFSAVLAVQGLWDLRRSNVPNAHPPN